MEMMFAVLILAAAPNGPCSGPDVRTLTKQVWLSGDYTALPIVGGFQPKMMKRLGPSSLQPIGAPVARAVIGGAALPRAHYYYLARTGYIGAWTSDFRRTNRDPEGISLEIKVAPGGVAYVTSSILSRDNGVGEFAVVIASPTQLTRVVSTCFAAA